MYIYLYNGIRHTVFCRQQVEPQIFTLATEVYDQKPVEVWPIALYSIRFIGSKYKK